MNTVNSNNNTNNNNNNNDKVSSASQSPKSVNNSQIKNINRSNSWSSTGSQHSRRSKSSPVSRSRSPISPPPAQSVQQTSTSSRSHNDRQQYQSRHNRSRSRSNNHHHHYHNESKSSTKRRSRTRSHSRHRSREKDQKRDSNRSNSYYNNYSSSYDYNNDRDRTEQYTSICIKNLNEKVDVDHLYDNIYAEFKRYGQFTIKIVNNKKSSSSHHTYTERIAFVNFYNHQTARSAKHDKINKYLCGLPMFIEPVYKTYKPGVLPPPPGSHHSSIQPAPPPPPPQTSMSYYNEATYSSSSRHRSRSPRHYSPQYRSSYNRRSRSRSKRSRSRSPINTSYNNQYNRSSRDQTYHNYEYRKPNSPPLPPHLSSHLPPQHIQQSTSHRSYSRHASPPLPPPPQMSRQSSIPQHYQKRRRSSSIDRYPYQNTRVRRTRSRSPIVNNNQVLAMPRTPPPVVNSVKHSKQDDLAYKLRIKSRSRSRSRTRSRSRSRSSRTNYQSAISHGGVTHYFDNDDKDATRTLFIGNLGGDVDKEELSKYFDKYGIIEDIDIKRNQPMQPPYMINATSSSSNGSNSADLNNMKKNFAFIRYENMDMAKQAKLNMNGKRIGSNEIKIGYGKVQPTNCLWIGGLNERTRLKDLEKEIKYILNTNDSSKFDILHKTNDLFCYVLFYNVKHAESVRYDLRGRILPNSSSDKLRIDFHDPKLFNVLKQTNPRLASLSAQATNNSSSLSTTSSNSSKRSFKSRSNSRSTSPKISRRVVQASPPPQSKSQSDINKQNIDIKQTQLNQSSRVKTPPLPSSTSSSSSPSRSTNESNSELRKNNKLNSIVSSASSNSNFENIIITKTDNVRRVDTIVINNSNNNNNNNKSKSRSKSPDKIATDLNQKQNQTLETKMDLNENITAVISSSSTTSNTTTKNDTINQSDSTKQTSRKHHHHHKHHKSTNGQSKKLNDEKDEGEIVDNDEFFPTMSNRQVIAKDNSIFLNEKVLNKLLLNKIFKNVMELRECLDSPIWSGLINLKKNTFPTKFYLLAGSRKFSEQLLAPHNQSKSGSLMSLQINQRIRLDSSKLDDIEKKLTKIESNEAECGYSVYLAIPDDIKRMDKIDYEKRSFHNLITYLNQKSAAGVVSLPDDNRPIGNLNIFTPNSNLSTKLLRQFVPELNFDLNESNMSDKSNEFELNDYLIVILFKCLNNTNITISTNNNGSNTNNVGQTTN